VRYTGPDIRRLNGIHCIIATTSILVLLAVMLLISCTPSADADTGWYMSADTLVITGDGPMDDYLENGELPWGNEFTGVLISEGVTSVGTFAFHDCSSIEIVKIAGSVEIIGEGAFKNCVSITTIILSDGLIEIGNDAFRRCTSISAISILGTVTAIGAYAFAEDSSISRLTLGYSLRTVRIGTFMRCSSLECVEIPDTVDAIEPYAFSNCSSLESVTIGKSVGVISAFAFRGCTSLAKVVNDSILAIWKGSTAHGYVARYAETVYTYAGEYFVEETGTVYLAHYVTVDECGSVSYYDTGLNKVEWTALSYITGYSDGNSRSSLVPPETPARAIPPSSTVSAPAGSVQNVNENDDMMLLATLAVVAIAALGTAIFIRGRF